MSYININTRQTLIVNSESSLQEAVVRYLRKTDLLYTATLGGFLDSDLARISAVKQGYGGNFRKGVPDLIIYTPNNNYNMLAIELKNPNGFGTVTKEQIKWLNMLEIECKTFTLVSNDLCEIIEVITKYINGILN